MTQGGQCTQAGRPIPCVAMLLFNNSTVGGAERRYAWVYQELRRRQAPIMLAINESLLTRLRRIGVLSDDEAPHFILKEPVGRNVFSLRKIDYALGIIPLARWIMRHRPKVLHLVLGGAYMALPLQLLGTAPPAVLSVVCPSLRELVGSTTGVHLYRMALRLATRVDALTESVRRMLAGEGVRQQRIDVPAGSCVDTNRFQPAEKRPWVVFSGRLVSEKNPLLFVRACAMVHERIKDRVSALRIFVLGEGPLQRAVDALVDELGLSSLMQVGWNDRVESVLNQALIFVSLQRLDNYPSQSLLEAMASGAAVVATDVGLTSVLVDEGVGRRVQADTKQVADAIIELLEDPSGTAAKGQVARERVMMRHSVDGYLDYIQDVYARAGD